MPIREVLQRLPRTRERDVVIVIPTVANPEVLIPSFQLLLQHMDGARATVVVSINPLDPEHGKQSAMGVTQLWHEYAPQLPDCNLIVVHGELPRGFGGAINDGLHVLLNPNTRPPHLRNVKVTTVGKHYPGLPDDGMVIVYNDDLHATPGWLQAMLAAPKSSIIIDSSEVPDPTIGGRPPRSREAYGEIGLVGPTSNYTAGIQQLNGAAMKMFHEMGEDRLQFSAWWRDQVKAEPVWTTVFLSGFCMGITSWAVDKLAERDGQRFACLFDERYHPAGYEDNDICARADRLGIRAAVAGSAWLHHLGSQTFDHEFPEAQRGLAMRSTYYDVWRPTLRAKASQRVVATYRTLVSIANDLSQWKASLANVARLADGVAVLLTGNPADCMSHPSWAQEMRGLMPDDLAMLKACADATTAQQVSDAVAAWLQLMLVQLPAQHGMPTRVRNIRVWTWDGEAFNERDERNALLAHAIEMDADWVLAVDSDEAVELRWTRAHLDRMMSHPDPLVDTFAVRFLNHWDTNRLVNNSRPWGDGGDYTGGMSGFRFFRVCKEDPRVILAGGHNGLHCGNIPQTDPMCKRASSWRMRHYGYLREQDRRRKLARYEQQDPNPNAMLIGGANYGHIVHEEHMIMTPYVPENGIGLVVLMYERENPNDLGRLLDQLHAVVDRVVLVWTGEWEEQDKSWAPEQPARLGATEHTDLTRYPYPVDGDPMGSTPWSTPTDQWPETGPSAQLARMAEHFGCEWVHHPLNQNLGAARNAGLLALRGTAGMSWVLFMDPDETVDMRQAATLGRMAECTDAMGWLFRFKNPYRDAPGAQSEGIRMCRLNPPDQEQMMGWSGRVHESMEPAARKLKESGFSNVIRVAPIVLVNTGLMGSDAAMQAKFDRYFRMSCMEIEDGPGPMTHVAWQTIALYFANEGCTIAAMEAMNRSVMTSSTAYLPPMLLAQMYARMAGQLLAEAERRAQGSSIGRAIAEQVQILGELAPPMVRHGAARDPAIRPLMTEGEALALLERLALAHEQKRENTEAEQPDE